MGLKMMSRINFSASLVVLCFGISSQVKAMRKSEIDIKKEPFGIVINIPILEEVVFLGNHEIVASESVGTAFVIDISDKNVFRDSIVPINDYRLSVCSDHDKKKAIISSRSTPSMVVYDSLSKEKKLIKLSLRLDGGTEWRPCFDESKSGSILFQTRECIYSYDYLNRDYNHALLAPRQFTKPALLYHQCIFDSLLKTDVIISGYQGGFEIHYESPLFLDKKISVESSSSYKNYRCSSDVRFIAHYSHEAQKFVSLEDEHAHTLLNHSAGCCITDIAKNNSTYLCDDKGIRVAPCSMQFHPNNKVLVTMSAADRVIHYWHAPTGQLLATGKRLPFGNDQGSFLGEVGKCNKYLSFSADGTLLAAVYPHRCVILDVPIEAIAALSRDTMIWMLWCLKNYKHEERALSRDILCLLLYWLKR